MTFGFFHESGSARFCSYGRTTRNGFAYFVAFSMRVRCLCIVSA